MKGSAGRQPLALLAVLASIWLVNAGLTLGLNHSDHVFPVTALPVFSGAAKTAVHNYTMDIVVEEGDEPIRLAMAKMYHAEMEVKPLTADFMHRGILNSFLKGCPDYRITGFVQCKGSPGDWEVPPDFAAIWLHMARLRLDIDQDPHSLTFVTVTRQIPSHGADPEPIERFTWYPAEGYAIVPATEGSP